MSLKVYAPATSANLNVGFDVLGLALQPTDGSLLGDIVTIEPGEERGPSLELEVTGPFAHKLPQDPSDNLISASWISFREALRLRGAEPMPLRLTLHKGLPVGSGLGSSACSVVAALHGLNLAHGEPLSRGELLTLMGSMEGRVSGSVHYDNVAPSYLGGLQLVLAEGEQMSCPLPCFERWRWVLCYSGVSLSTAQARGALPSHYTLSDCLSYGRALAGFIHACHTGDEALALGLMRDVIAEPYRAPLTPGLRRLRRYVEGTGELLVTGISGAGPTLFALVNGDEHAARLAEWMRAHLIERDEGFVVICKADQRGARSLEEGFDEAV